MKCYRKGGVKANTYQNKIGAEKRHCAQQEWRIAHKFLPTAHKAAILPLLSCFETLFFFLAVVKKFRPASLEFMFLEKFSRQCQTTAAHLCGDLWCRRWSCKGLWNFISPAPEGNTGCWLTIPLNGGWTYDLMPNNQLELQLFSGLGLCFREDLVLFYRKMAC